MLGPFLVDNVVVEERRIKMKKQLVGIAVIVVMVVIGCMTVSARAEGPTVMDVLSINPDGYTVKLQDKIVYRLVGPALVFPSIEWVKHSLESKKPGQGGGWAHHYNEVKNGSSLRAIPEGTKVRAVDKSYTKGNSLVKITTVKGKVIGWVVGEYLRPAGKDTYTRVHDPRGGTVVVKLWTK